MTKKRPKKEINPLFTTDDWLIPDEPESEEERPRVDSNGIRDAIFKYVESGVHNMAILNSDEYFAVVAKIVSKNVIQKSEKSLFQPHEKTEIINLCVVTLLDFTPYNFGSSFINMDYEFRALSIIGCPTIRITQVEDVVRVLESI
jgi:hypothetical protein